MDLILNKSCKLHLNHPEECNGSCEICQICIKKKKKKPNGLCLCLSSDTLLVWENILHFLLLLSRRAPPPPPPAVVRPQLGLRDFALVKDKQGMHLNKSHFGGCGVGVDENDLALILHCLVVSWHCPLFLLNMWDRCLLITSELLLF